MTSADGDREVLAGLVERVTYHNPENGFCVLRIKARRSAASSRIRPRRAASPGRRLR
jgi:hypothetical protein